MKPIKMDHDLNTRFLYQLIRLHPQIPYLLWLTLLVNIKTDIICNIRNHILTQIDLTYEHQTL
jgi:hypothetical protein